MDSVQSFKGYGKVNEAEEREFKQKSRRRILIISISVIVLATVIIGSVVGTVIHKSNNNSTAKESTPISQVSSVKAVCSVTLYPKSCISSLSNLRASNDSNGSVSNQTDPQKLFILSMEVAISELVSLASLPDKIISLTNNTRLKAALGICKDLFNDSIDELQSSISSIEGKSQDEKKKYLSSLQIDDIKTWISTALTNQETCLDGLSESDKDEIFNQVKTAMQNSTEYTSNSLAIVSKVISLLDDFDVSIHRKLLGTNQVSHYGFPLWVRSSERRLLQEATPTPDITVASDGSGDYKTIQEAVNGIGKKNKTRTVVYVKAGKYVENVLVDKAHWNIMMYGDGNTKTIVSGSLNYIDGTPTFTTATFIVTGKGFMAKDIGFENTAGPDKHQAVAFRSGSDESVFYRCSFNAYQDTLYAHSNRQFYRDCDITGTIDFIFGNAAVVFQNCNIQPRQPMPNQFVTITAQGKKDPNQNTGISIHRSTIAPLGSVTAKTYLGRPWKNYSTTVIMETEIGAVVNPIGWIEWVYNVTPPSTIFYAEYQNTGPGSTVDKRVTWPGYKSTLTEDVAAQYTVESFIQGTQWLPQTSVTFDASL